MPHLCLGFEQGCGDIKGTGTPWEGPLGPGLPEVLPASSEDGFSLQTWGFVGEEKVVPVIEYIGSFEKSHVIVNIFSL